MIRRTRADIKTEEWITAFHESAHVVFAVINGRIVKWVTIKPKKVIIHGIPGMSLGRWDISDTRNINQINSEEKKQHIQITLAGPIAEEMITKKQCGIDGDMDIAIGCCKFWGLDIDDMRNETAQLVKERSEIITRLAKLLVKHKTLDEKLIKQTIFQSE